MELNEKQCIVAHFVDKNPQHQYFIQTKTGENHILASSTSEKDLGVIFDINLKWMKHIATVISKANRKLGMVKKLFKIEASQ